MARNKESIPISSGMHNVLATGTILKGNITAEEDFRIDGCIEGTINCRGKIIAGPNSTIKAEIECVNIELFGKITGNISCSDTIILRASSILEGDIKTRTIEIEPGAKFYGSCQMQD